MWDADSFDEDGGGTVFRDVLLLALIGFVAMVIMMLPHLAKKEQNTEEQKSPGNVVVEMHWPDELDVDVDLWVQAPGDIPVGFFNQGSRFLNLLRDVTRDSERSVLIVTHNSVTAKMADRVIRLRDGQIVDQEINPSPAEPEQLDW